MARLTLADVVRPRGRLSYALFAGESRGDVDATLTGYIARGYELLPAGVLAVGDAVSQEAVTAYVYWRVYEGLVEELSRRPQSVTIPGEIAETRTDRQLDIYTTLAERYRGIWEVYAPPTTASVAGERRTRPSGSMHHRITFG